MKEQILTTISISTKNRPEFLLRLLCYYAITKYPGWILIGDSSEGESYKINRVSIANLRSKLKIMHFHVPELNAMQAATHLSKFISTPYCLAVADDDFVCTEGISQCVDFLEGHPDYIAAHGLGGMFGINKTDVFGKMNSLLPYFLTVTESDNAAGRLFDFFNPVRNLNLCLMRTRVWKKIFSFLPSIPNLEKNSPFAELTIDAMAVTMGKVKELDCLYHVRHAHEGTTKWPDTYDWITGPTWQSQLMYFYETIIPILMIQDGITDAQAKSAIKIAFWPFLASALETTLKQKEPRNKSELTANSVLRTWIVATPERKAFFRCLLGYINSIVPRGNDEISLPALLRKSSKYHRDFMPIYRVVEKAPIAKTLIDRTL
jgi:glycosyltransferase domain-containing protein